MMMDSAAGHEGPISRLDGLPVVTAPVELDAHSAIGFGEELAAAAVGHPTIIADMTGTRFCDSAGLHALLIAIKHARTAGGEVRVVMTASRARRLFAVTGVDRLARLFDTLAEAAAAALPAPMASPETG